MNGICDVCGNEYDKAFRVTRGKDSFTFDSIECAAIMMAPECHHCHCRILGHGVEVNGTIYCCANCVRQDGKRGIRDRLDKEIRKSA